MANPPGGFIADIEEVAQIVADWFAKTVMEIGAVLMPDGRPFDYVEDPQMKMRDYLQLRGNPEAWSEYILAEAQKITQKLQASGLSEDKILAVHPYDLAQKFAVEFSVEMESHLRKGEKNAKPGATGSPILPTGSGAQSPVGNPA